MRAHVFRSSLLCAALALLFLPGSFASAAPDPEVDAPVTEWLEEKRLFFEAHPGHKSSRGSGWKPYQRFKWFQEQRMVSGEEPALGARWRAWEEKTRRDRTIQAGATWFSVGPSNVAGRMLALAFDPSNTNILYAGAAGGGVWKSTDAGVSWTAMTDGEATLAVGGIAVWPNDPNVVVIGTGEGSFNIDRIGGVGVLRSTDGGVTWNTTSLSFSVSGGSGFHFVRANPINGTLLAGTTTALYRSTDGGATWTEVRSGGNYYDAQWKPGDANVVFTAKGNSGTGNNVKISTDDGVNWMKAGGTTGNQPPSLAVGKTKIGMSADDPNTIYAIIEERGVGTLLGVYRSTNQGTDWTLRTNTPSTMLGTQGWYNVSCVVDPDDANLVIAGGVALYRSTNGGLSFSGTGSGTVHVDHHDAVYRPGASNTLFVATDGGIWESPSDGAPGSWADRNSGLVTYQFYDICVNNHGAVPDFIMGGTQDQGTDRWSGTDTWSEGLGGDGMVCNINPVNGSVVYAETQSGNHRKNTSAGVGGWSQINAGITTPSNWVAPVDEDQSVGNHLYTSTQTQIYRTTNGGTLWVAVASHSATWISISRLDGNVVWTGGSNVHYTTDDGANWTQAAGYGFLTGGVTKILAHPTDVNAALVTFSGYDPSRAHVAMTTDMGASWHDVTGDFPSQPVNAIAIDPSNPGHWFIGTDVGVWVSTNQGTNWVPFETGLPNTVVCDLEIQTATNRLFAGTHGRGAWQIDISGITRIEPEESEIDLAPTATARLTFDPPSPNPVASEATFRFGAWHDGEVTLSVYDILGRRVSEVSRMARGDGIIRWVTWYADDHPNGVYFAVLRAGEERITRKIVVAR